MFSHYIDGFYSLSDLKIALEMTLILIVVSYFCNDS